MAKLLLGKEVTDALNAKLIERAAALKEKDVTPTLGILRIGENPSDLSYEKGASKRAELIGIEVKKFLLPEDASKEAVLSVIDKLNAAKPGSSEFEAASKEMTELSEELQATSEKCQKLAPNFTKEQKQRFLKAAMKFASASKKIKIDV